jgi:hypothetical protein
VIVTPGTYPTGTNHFAHADAPADCARAADYRPPTAPGPADYDEV